MFIVNVQEYVFSSILQICWTCLLALMGFLRIFQNFFLYEHVTSIKTEMVLLLPFQLRCPFSCLISLHRTPNAILNKRSKNRYPYLVPDHREKAFSLLLLNMMLAWVFYRWSLSDWWNSLLFLPRWVFLLKCSHTWDSIMRRLKRGCNFPFLPDIINNIMVLMQRLKQIEMLHFVITTKINVF